MGIREYLDDAIRNKKTVTIKYIKYEGVFSIREISDIQYSDEYGNDYIQAFCHKRQEIRTFKISRIRAVDDISDIPTNNYSAKKTKSAYTGNSAVTGTHTTKPSVTPTSSSFKAIPNSISISVHKPDTYNNSSYTQSSKTNSEGCYIATMAYGDYDHPQVIILRRYRDEVLMPSLFGRLLVKVYYFVSPKLVSLLRRHEKTNVFIRRLLNKYITLIIR